LQYLWQLIAEEKQRPSKVPGVGGSELGQPIWVSRLQLVFSAHAEDRKNIMIPKDFGEKDKSLGFGRRY